MYCIDILQTTHNRSYKKSYVIFIYTLRPMELIVRFTIIDVAKQMRAPKRACVAPIRIETPPS